MLYICYWFHFTYDIEYHNMVDSKKTRWNEKNYGSSSISTKKFKNVNLQKHSVLDSQ